MPTNRLIQYLKPESPSPVNRVFDYLPKTLNRKQITEAQRIQAANLLQPVAEMRAIEVLRYLEDMGLRRKLEREFQFKTGKKVPLTEPLLIKIRNSDGQANLTSLKKILSDKLSEVYKQRISEGLSFDAETIKAIVEYLMIDDFEFNDEIHLGNQKFTQKRLDQYRLN